MILDESIFNEEEQVLPDAKPAEPIVVSTEVVEAEPESGPEPGPAVGVAEMLMNLIKDELEAIQGYNTFLATINEQEEFEELKATIEHINSEENKHVGELQYLLQLVSPNAQNIDMGQKEAEEETKGEVDEPVVEEFKGKFWEKPGYDCIEDDKTNGRAYRVGKYRKLCGLDEDFVITEENLDEEAIKQISCYDLVTPEKLRAELLGQEWGE